MEKVSYQTVNGPAVFAGWRSATGLDLLFEAVSRVYGVLVTWQSRVSDRRHLATLDPRLLKDMGLTRVDADREALKPFWRA